MLKLKKTNLAQKASQAMDTEDDTLFVEESTLKDALNNITQKQ